MRFSRLFKFVTVVENLLTPLVLKFWLRFFLPKQKPKYQKIDKSLLYVAASSLPYNISGYTIRTQSLLKAMQIAGLNVSVQTRPGYPWDRHDCLVEALNEKTVVNGIVYNHARKPTRYRPILAFALQGATEIEDAAKRHNASIIHSASNYANALPALFAARRLGILFHYEMRGIWELTRISREPSFKNSAAYNLGMKLEAFVARHADCVYVISDALGNFIQEEWGIEANKIKLLPNCVNSDEIISSDVTGNIEPMTIVYAGSLIAYEGLDILLDALALLKHQGKDIKLQILGDGEERFNLESKKNTLGLQDSVKFLGLRSQEEVKAIISRCALVCIPRKSYEVCKIVAPFKLLESMSLGKAVIVPNLKVFQDELKGEELAIFFQADDAEDLARVINDALKKIDKLNLIGKNAQKYILKKRVWSKFISKNLNTHEMKAL